MAIEIFIAIAILSAGASYMQAKKAQKKAKEMTEGVEANIESNSKEIPVVYGERRVGGTRVYIDTSRDRKHQYLYMVIAMAEGEVESITDIKIDDIPVSDSRFITSGNKQNLWYDVFTGTDNQTVSTLIKQGTQYDTREDVWNDPYEQFHDTDIGIPEVTYPWGDDHKLSGIAYIALKFKWDENAYTGIPDVTAVVKGRKVYNPDTGVTEWSDNPALCIRDYLTNERFGKGLPASAIDDAAFIQAANDLDNFTITPYTGASTTQKLFRMNHVVDTSKKIMENLNDMIIACRGFIPYSKGVYSLKIDQTSSSVLSIGADQIISGIAISGARKEDRFNQVKVNFYNAASEYKEDQAIYPEQNSTLYQQYLTEDEGEPLVDEVDLYSINNYYSAREMARLFLERSRQNMTIAFQGTSELINLEVGEVVSITHPTPSWTNKLFQVQEVALAFDGTVQITCIEYDASLYTYDTPDEEQAYVGTRLPDPNQVDAPTALTTTTGTYIEADGKAIGYIDLSWTAPEDSLVDRYELKFEYSSREEVIELASTEYRFKPTQDNVSYVISVRAVNGLGIRSAWLTAAAVTSVIDTTAPSNITGITATGGLQSITLDWTNPSEDDFDLVRIKHNTTNTEPSSHSFEVRSDSFVHDIGAYSTTKYYWLAPVDRTGNVGNYVSGGSATTGSIAIDDVPAVAGTFYLTLGDNNAPTDVEFNNAVGRNPVEGDVAVVNKAYFFTRGASSWSSVTEFIDGSLLVSDSVTASEINVTNLSSLSSDLGAVTAGSIDINSGVFTVNSSGDMTASSAVIDGNITAESLDVEGATITGELTVPIDWSNANYDNAISADNVDDSITNLIDERISNYGLGTAGDFGSDTGTFNDSATTDALITTFDHGTKDVDITIKASRTWSKTFQGAPLNADADNDVTLTLYRKKSADSSWTSVTSWDRDTESGIVGGDYVNSYGDVYYNGVTINLAYTDLASGLDDNVDYDYKVVATNVGTNYDETVTFTLEANEIGTASVVDNNNYVDSFSINDSTGVITVGRTGSLSDLTADISTYVASQTGASTDTLDDVTDRGATTTNAVTVGSLTTGSGGNIQTGVSASITSYGNVTATYGYVKSGTGFYVNQNQVIDTARNATFVDGTFTGDVKIEKTSPTLTLKDSNSATGSYPKINFDTTNNQGVTLYHTEFDSELPVGGYGLVLDASAGNAQYPTTGELAFVVKGEIYAGDTTLDSTNKVYHAGNFTDNSTNWNTAYGWGDHSTQGYLTSYSETDTLADVTGRGSTTNSSLTLNGKVSFGSNGTYHYSPSGARANNDARDSGDGARLHRWNRNHQDTAYLPYYENWYDGNSYHSIGIDSNRWKLSDGLDVSGTVTATGGNSTNWNTAYSWGNHASAGYLKYTTSSGSAGESAYLLSIGKSTDHQYIQSHSSQPLRLNPVGNAVQIGTGNHAVFHDGYHPNADKWTTARTLSLTGDVTGSVSWDGSANASITATVANDSHTHDTRYVQQGGTSFSGEYPMVVRVSDRNFYSDGNVKFRGSDSRLTVDGIVNTPTYQVNSTTVIDSSRNLKSIKNIHQTEVHRPDVNYSSLGNTTGRIKIALPDTSSTYDMMTIELTVYEYNSKAGSKIYISGHNWTSGWYNYSVHVVGGYDDPIYLARSSTDGKHYIILGDTGTGWQYVTVHVDKVTTAGFYSAQDWTANWTITKVTTDSTTYSQMTANLNQVSSTTQRTRGMYRSEGGYKVGGTTVIDSSRTITTPRINIGDGNDGYFYSDTNGRTAFRSGDFYIQSSVGNYYNYATVQWHGNTSGDEHKFRSNILNGNNWDIDSSGNISGRTFEISGSTVIDANRNISGVGSISASGSLTVLGAGTSGFDGTSGIAIGGANPAISFASSASGRQQYLLYNTSGMGGSLRLYEADSNKDVFTVHCNSADKRTFAIGHSSGSTWATDGRTVLSLDGTATSLLEFRNQNSPRGYIYSYGSTIEHWSYGAIDLVPSGSANYKVRLDSDGLNSTAGFRVNGTTVIDSSRNLTNIGNITALGGTLLVSKPVSATAVINGHDAYHGIQLRGEPTGASTHTASDVMSFYEYGGIFKFFKRIPTGLTLGATIDNGSITAVGNLTASNGWVKSGSGGFYVSGTQIVDSSRNIYNIANVHLPRSGFITFYGNNNGYHGIGSRNHTGGQDDDIRINSYGAVNINLDSNNNNSTSGSAGFRIGRHGLDTGTMQNLIFVNGETCYTEMYDTSTGTGFTYLAFENSGGTTTYGSIYRSYSTMVYATSSDYRLKENVVDLTNASARINQLPVKRFNFIEHPDRTVDGFLAHEVQDVVPEAVIGTKDEVDEDGNAVHQSIDQSKLVPLLTAGLQEALAEIENLKARLSALEN